MVWMVVIVRFVLTVAIPNLLVVCELCRKPTGELAYFSTSGYLSEAGSSIKRFSTGFFRGFIVGKRLLKVILNIDIFL